VALYWTPHVEKDYFSEIIPHYHFFFNFINNNSLYIEYNKMTPKLLRTPN
jgi:hypothetical protein